MSMVHTQVTAEFLICRQCMKPVAYASYTARADQDCFDLALACHGEREVVTFTGSEITSAEGFAGRLHLIYQKSRLLSGEPPLLPEEED